ncbi:WD40 repeat domain-containing serine/threonine-protein kinase [Calothrix sp. UHCC 0171]|uniref:WD40 repeat domain-containing serine/threonine-protein kinase n=1 Tax=Calothrix sp. UHCC 0171 TaxID=3110245 RepID=UPI002B1FCC4C|nr:WD40 repeat domain-containing serine/threonine-protein kinase [Calothrix sp. UHCC 0171]MEA5573919.1 WD40 repeat domain-containing serine/threonine-protein kinase [Calothrix sp. UHCC 0171]
MQIINSKVVFPMFLEPAYRLIKLIGNSEFTQTFIAVDERDYPFSACVVQKIFRRSQFCQNQNIDEKINLLQRLETYSLSPKLFSYHYKDDYIYLIFEYVEGKNLNQSLSVNGKLNEVQIWQLLTDILPELELLHNWNLIHCNIKPTNIIDCRNSLQQKFILVDFANIQIFDNIHDYANNIISGSPEYLAPEQLDSYPVFSSDLYSLGVTCIYALTDVSPFYLFDSANNQWVWRDYLQTEISERLANLLDKLINKDINQRFHSAKDVMEVMGIASISPKLTLKSQVTNQEFPKLANLYTLTSSTSLISEVNTVAIHPNNHNLVSGHQNKNIYIWNFQSQKFLQSISGHSQAIESLAFSPDGKILASASADKTIKLWKTQNYQEIITLVGHIKAVKSVVFSPNHKYLASGSWDKTIKIWDVKDAETATEICTLTGHKQQVSSVAFSPDGLYIASGSFDRTACIWKLPPYPTKPQNQNYPECILSGHTWAVLTVAFSPNGEILATGSDDNTIKLWEIKTGREIATLSGHSWSVTGLTFDKSGKFLISSSKDKTIKIWRVSNQEEITNLCSHEDSVTAIAYNFYSDLSPHQLIISGSQDKTIKVWEIELETETET